jgi:transposase
MPDLAAWLAAAHGVTADPSSLSKLLCWHGFTYKKACPREGGERCWHRRKNALTSRRPAGRGATAASHFMRRQPGRLVFIDETSIKTNMTPLRGRSLKGERLIADAPFGKWRTQTFIAGQRCHELVAPWIVEGAMDGRTFDSYIRTQLAPCLRRGDVVIPATNFVRADNLNVHKSPRAAQTLAECGAWFLFLPKYSPDLNPIEQAFAKLKTLLRKAKARTYDALWRAVGNICNLF